MGTNLSNILRKQALAEAEKFLKKANSFLPRSKVPAAKDITDKVRITAELEKSSEKMHEVYMEFNRLLNRHLQIKKERELVRAGSEEFTRVQKNQEEFEDKIRKGLDLNLQLKLSRVDRHLFHLYLPRRILRLNAQGEYKHIKVEQLGPVSYEAATLFFEFTRNYFFSAVAKCDRCKRFFINLRKNKRYCSHKCASHATAEKATKKRRERERRKRMKRAKNAVDRWNHLAEDAQERILMKTLAENWKKWMPRKLRGPKGVQYDQLDQLQQPQLMRVLETAWKAWVANKSGVTTKWLTRAVNKGRLSGFSLDSIKRKNP